MILRTVYTFIFVVLLVAIGFQSGARLNVSPSLPKGLYWVVDKTPEKGDLIEFQPPATELFKDAVKRGYINQPSFSLAPGTLLKRIAAVAGDRVSVSPDTITVNGRPLKNATIHCRDGKGRPLIPWVVEDYELSTNEYFLYSDFTPHSFDSRYFGVQGADSIVNVVRPVLIYVPYN